MTNLTSFREKSNCYAPGNICSYFDTKHNYLLCIQPVNDCILVTFLFVAVLYAPIWQSYLKVTYPTVYWVSEQIQIYEILKRGFRSVSVTVISLSLDRSKVYIQNRNIFFWDVVRDVFHYVLSLQPYIYMCTDLKTCRVRRNHNYIANCGWMLVVKWFYGEKRNS